MIYNNLLLEVLEIVHLISSYWDKQQQQQKEDKIGKKWCNNLKRNLIFHKRLSLIGYMNDAEDHKNSKPQKT